MAPGPPNPNPARWSPPRRAAIQAVAQASAAPSAARSARTSSAALLFTAGLLALAVGALVYLTDRDPAQVMALPATVALGMGPLFGAVSGWLPSFVHTFAFSLFSAAAWPGARRPAYGACALWWAVNLAFEAAQQPPWRAALAPVWSSGPWDFAPLGWVARYVQQGRFDPADLLAISAGALAAAAVLCVVHQLREIRHAC